MPLDHGTARASGTRTYLACGHKVFSLGPQVSASGSRLQRLVHAGAELPAQAPLCSSQNRMEGQKIYVVAGVTSNLFSALITTVFAGHQGIYATVRQESLPAQVGALATLGVNFVTREEGLDLVKSGRISRCLWLSKHDDPDLVRQIARLAPTLVINSAAIMDYVRGIATHESLNGYQKSKLAMYEISGVWTFVPGFFIEDVPTPAWASKGLHGDTTAKILAKDRDPAFDWSKAYSVTSKRKLAQAIARWVENPDAIHKNTPVIVCTDRTYSREELREHNAKQIYSNFVHVDGINFNDFSLPN